MRLLSARPVFQVRDMQAALQFYDTVLGMKVQDGDAERTWVELVRDNVTLALYIEGLREQPSGDSLAAFFVDDATAFAKEIESRSGHIDHPLFRHPSGRYLDFSLLDPSGNRLIFAELLL